MILGFNSIEYSKLSTGAIIIIVLLTENLVSECLQYKDKTNIIQINVFFFSFNIKDNHN